MRFAPITNLMGWTLTVVSIPMAIIGLIGFLIDDISSEYIIRAFIIPIVLGLITGLLMIWKTRDKFDQEDGVRDREAVTAVALVLAVKNRVPFFTDGVVSLALNVCG